MSGYLWPSKAVHYTSMIIAAAFAVVTAWLLFFYQPILARGIVGAIVIAFLWGFNSRQPIVGPVQPSFRLPQDFKLTLRNMLIIYFWMTILGLSTLCLYYALAHGWNSLAQLL